MNLALAFIVLATVALVFLMWNWFGRQNPMIDPFETEDTVDDIAENNDATGSSEISESNIVEEDAQDAEDDDIDYSDPDLQRSREFAQHLVRRNIYKKAHDAYRIALGGQPTLDDVVAIINAYREGRATLDNLQAHIRENMQLPDAPTETPEGEETAEAEETEETDAEAEETEETAEAEETDAATEAEETDAAADAEQGTVEGFSPQDIISSELMARVPSAPLALVTQLVREIGKGMITFGEAVLKLSSASQKISSVKQR
nr:hypothetical protein TetV2_00579 [Oceanusvirus sp.]